MNELHNYIVEARASGQADSDTMAALVVQGWGNDEILAGFLEVDKLDLPVVEKAANISDFAVPSDPVLPVTTPQAAAFAPIEPLRKERSTRKFNIPLKLIFGLLGIVVGGVLIWFFISRSGSKKTTENVKVENNLFAGYSVLKKDLAIKLNDSTEFVVNGANLVGGVEYNLSQTDELKVPSPEEQSVLLVYYNATNLSDSVITIFNPDTDIEPFKIVDSNAKRVDIKSVILDESVVNLHTLKPNQYMSDALVFLVPGNVGDIHKLYLTLNSESVTPVKGYLQL
ncbi:MAG: hypothetical protein M3P33_01845 [bacterium]|nr:hypothetical protein [bacterium]